MKNLGQLFDVICNYDDAGFEMLDGALSQDSLAQKIYDKWMSSKMDDSVLKPQHADYLKNTMSLVVDELEEIY